MLNCTYRGCTEKVAFELVYERRPYFCVRAFQNIIASWLLLKPKSMEDEKQ
jgi:hypothetical protein